MMILTERVYKTYQNGFTAVKDLSLQVNKGDVFGFLGPNGAGKTTTIRMLDGLLTPTSGTIHIGGKDIRKDLLEIKKIIGVVPESHGYYYWMTASEYLQYFNTLFYERKSNGTYIDELLGKVGLSEKRHISIGQFSRGMKQRLGIAKALINHPKIVFLDEPTLGLDPRGQKEIQQLIGDMNRNEGITVFITSHLLKDIEVLCNKVCIIKDAQIVEQDSIAELRKKYRGPDTVLLKTNNTQGAFSLLQRQKQQYQVYVNDEIITVSFDPGLTDQQINQEKHQIVSGLLTAGIDIKEFTQKALSMEDIFFEATETTREVKK
ncbi:MAG: ABC transporter ATP-binding protein [Sphaerochaeta sp.]